MDKKTINAIKRHRTARLAKLVGNAYLLHRKKRDKEIATLICEEFVSLGGVYLKFMQGVLLRSKLMTNWKSPDKLRIFENLHTEPLDIVSILRSQLTREKLSQITSVQPEPFAAGTFGQVYYATLADGRPIIIKVLRPMIKETLKYDLKLLNIFMQRFYIKVMSKNIDTDAREALSDFAAATMNETNYKEEVEFACELYDEYKESKELYIPETFKELCTDTIIVQEYVSGISLAEILKLKEHGVDPKTYVRDQLGSNLDTQLETLGFELLRGAFDLPRIQGDPHPGNIRLLPNDQVGLIDFGISAKAPDDKASFLAIIDAYDGVLKGSQTITDLFEKSLRFFVKDLYRSLMTISKFVGEQAEKALPKQIGMIAERTFEQATGTKMIDIKDGQEERAIADANKMFNEGNRFGLIMRLEDTAIIRSSQSYTTLLISIGRYKQVMPRVTSRVLDYVHSKYPEASNDTASVSIGDAIETVSSWLERVADRDPKLFRELSKKIRLNSVKIDEREEPNA